jgi:hypothetical protein
MEISITIKDSEGNQIEINKVLSDKSIISHDFSKIEGLVEHIRTDMLKDVEREILEKNQVDYVKKTLG